MPSVLSRQLFGICLVLCVLVLPALALLEKTDAPAPIHVRRRAHTRLAFVDLAFARSLD